MEMRKTPLLFLLLLATNAAWTSLAFSTQGRTPHFNPLVIRETSLIRCHPSQTQKNCMTLHHPQRHHVRTTSLRDATTPNRNTSPSSSSSGKTKQQTDVPRKVLNFAKVLWRFSRPHTIIGSALAIPALHLFAAPTYADALTWRCFQSILYAMIPACLMNVYITGLNQITDVEIDKVNKPDLPLAAGDMSMRSAKQTVITCLVASLAMGTPGLLPASTTLCTQGLSVALWMSGILGTLYSLEPFRLKKHPLLAAFCIVAVRGAIINASFFAHAKVAAFRGAAGAAATGVWNCLRFDMRCYQSSLYFAIFGIVIALMKDVPDIKGDELSNIRTFSVRLGPKRIFGLTTKVMMLSLYSIGINFLRGAWTAIDGFTSLSSTHQLTTCLGRGVVGIAAMGAASSIAFRSRKVDPENAKEVYSFYMHLWKLFYLSYLVLPFAR